MKFYAALVLVSCLSLATGYRSILQVTPQTNFRPVNITVSSAPFDIIATPITPSAPYSQRAYQCNVTGDSRYPPFASGTFPLTVTVPVGQRVRVIFANGNLNGQTVTQSGEPGVIVQQSGSPIVQQMGGASPIVQNAGSPVVQSNAPPTAQVMQQAATVVQQKPAYSQSPVVQQSSPVVQQSSPVVQQSSPVVQQSSPVVQQSSQSSPVVQQSSPVVQQSSPVVQQSTPAATPAKTNAPTTPAPTPPKTPASPVVQQTSPTTPAPTPPKTPASPVVQQTSPTTPAATPAQTPASPVVQQSSVVQQSPVVQQTPPAQQSSVVQQPGRRLLQDRVPGGPNNGLVEYIALVSANTVSGFVVPNTQFGVPYVEFTASAAAAGQTASFQGVLEVAQVVGGVPLYPFRPNASLSPECQVNVNFKVAAASG